MRIMIWRTMLAMAACALCGGCESVGFEILEPHEFTGHISANRDTHFGMGGLEYPFQAAGGRVVAKIYNHQEIEVELMGDRSVVVDPSGESHPLHDQTIAPDSFIREIFPPFPPRDEEPGPAIHFGVFYGQARETDQRVQYLDLDESAYHWEWNGATEVRITLVYLTSTKKLEHTFVIRKLKK